MKTSLRGFSFRHSVLILMSFPLGRLCICPYHTSFLCVHSFSFYVVQNMLLDLLGLLSRAKNVFDTDPQAATFSEFVKLPKNELSSIYRLFLFHCLKTIVQYHESTPDLSSIWAVCGANCGSSAALNAFFPLFASAA